MPHNLSYQFVEDQVRHIPAFGSTHELCLPGGPLPKMLPISCCVRIAKLPIITMVRYSQFPSTSTENEARKQKLTENQTKLGDEFHIDNYVLE